METGTTIIDAFEVNYRWGQYRAGGSLPFSVTLYSCEEDTPPLYDDYRGNIPCHLEGANLSNAIVHCPCGPEKATPQGVSRAGRRKREGERQTFDGSSRHQQPVAPVDQVPRGIRPGFAEELPVRAGFLLRVGVAGPAVDVRVHVENALRDEPVEFLIPDPAVDSVEFQRRHDANPVQSETVGQVASPICSC